jgi:hypothetical protein
VDLGGRDVACIFLKICCKPIGQVACHLIVREGGGPGIPGVEEFGRDAGAAGRDGHTKDRMGVIFHFVEGAFEGGGDHSARERQLNTIALAIGSAGPSGIDHPNLDPVLFDLPTQQFSVAAGVEGEEWGAKAGTEGGFRLGDPGFGAGHLCGIAGDELVHGLPGIEPGNGGEDAIGIASKEENIGRDAANGRFECIIDIGEGVRDAGIFGDRAVVKVDAVSAGVEFDVLHESAGTDGAINCGLLILAEVDAFGVAAAFEIEYIVFGPPVFVVADEPACRVGAKGGLAGAAEAEEDGGVAFWAYVGGAVHTQDVPVARQEEVEDSKDGLFDLTGIGRAGEHDQPVAEGDDDGGRGSGATFGGVEGEAGSGQDLPVGAKVFEFFLGGPQEHIVGEEVATGGLVDDPDIKAVTRVGADMAIAHEEFRSLVEPCSNGGKDAMKTSRIDGLVEVVPVDGAGGDLVFYDIAVFGATAGEGACTDDECTGIAQHCFLPPKAMPGKVFRWELIVDGIGDTQTKTEKTFRRESNDGH